jgi:hypothetical protein
MAERKKDKSIKPAVIAGIAAGSTASLGKELFALESAGGATSRFMKTLSGPVGLPKNVSYHVSNLLTKRLPAVGIGTFAGNLAYDYVKKKTGAENDPSLKSKILPGLAAGAAASISQLPVTLLTNSFPKELNHLKGGRALATILKSRMGQALIAAPVGFATYHQMKKLTGEDSTILPAIASGVAGTIATTPLAAKYEGLRSKPELAAKVLAGKLESKSPFLAKKISTGITRGHLAARVLKSFPSRLSAGILGALISYPVYEHTKKYLVNKGN